MSSFISRILGVLNFCSNCRFLFNCEASFLSTRVQWRIKIEVLWVKCLSALICPSYSSTIVTLGAYYTFWRRWFYNFISNICSIGEISLSHETKKSMNQERCNETPKPNLQLTSWLQVVHEFPNPIKINASELKKTRRNPENKFNFCAVI